MASRRISLSSLRKGIYYHVCTDAAGNLIVTVQSGAESEFFDGSERSLAGTSESYDCGCPRCIFLKQGLYSTIIRIVCGDPVLGLHAQIGSSASFHFITYDIRVLEGVDLERGSDVYGLVIADEALPRLGETLGLNKVERIFSGICRRENGRA